jgi:hypothetical protein
VEDVQELAFMNATDIYRQAIKRTFADLYGVERHEVDVSWNNDGESITDVVARGLSPPKTLMVDCLISRSTLFRATGCVIAPGYWRKLTGGRIRRGLAVSYSALLA